MRWSSLLDNDEHGQAAAVECAQILSPGKAKIATLPLKDASDMLQAGREEELDTRRSGTPSPTGRTASSPWLTSASGPQRPVRWACPGGCPS